MASKSSRSQVSSGNGFMYSRKVEYSKETQELLTQMMKESRLTNLQQRQINARVKNGDGLPTSENNSAVSRRQCSKQTSNKQSARVGGGRRSLDTIKQLEQGQEDYSPSLTYPKYNSTIEKERLHNIMAFGTPSEDRTGERKQIESRNNEEEEEEVDRFDEVLKEIEERKEFLNDMAKLGMADKYRTQVNTEISQRIRELEQLDSQRTKNSTC